MAMALDAIERTVNICCSNAVELIKGAKCMQNELKYDLQGAVSNAAEIYDVDIDELSKETWWMLRNELNRSLRPICEVRYVKPYTKDGKTVGMETKVYKFDWDCRNLVNG